MNSSTMKTRGRCTTVCIPDTSGRVCVYCHFEILRNNYIVNNKLNEEEK